MPKHGKKYKNALAQVDRQKRYLVDEAVALATSLKYSKFDESFDAAFRLGVDPKYADQMLRGSISLPHGTGKKTRVLVFAKGEKATDAEKAGADYVGAEDLVEKINGGWLDFDVAIATPDMMKIISKLGRVLGTKGLMPNPKLGTVTLDVAKAVKEQKAGKIEYRTEKTGIVHVSVGKVSMGTAKLTDNLKAIINEIIRVKPSTAKGQYLKSLTISSTMGPGLKIDIASVQSSSK